MASRTSPTATGSTRRRRRLVELEVLTYRGERARAIVAAAAARRGEIYRAAARAPRRERRRDPRALSADPAPRLRLQPRRAAAGERLRRRARARRHRVDVRDDPRGDARADPAARRALARWSLGYPDMFRAADHVTERPRAPARSALEGDRRHADRGHDASTASTSTSARMLPEGGGWLLVEFGGDDAGRGRRAGPRADAPTLRSDGAEPPAMKLYRRSEQTSSTSGRCARRASARRRSCPASADTCEGWEDSAVPPEQARRLPARARAAARRATATTARSTATSARAASTRASTSTSSRRAGIADVPPLHRRGGGPRASSLRRLALRRARRRPVARRAAAEDVRPRAGRARSASSSRSGTRTGR